LSSVGRVFCLLCRQSETFFFFHREDKIKMLVYYEEIKRDLNRILIYECRCDERRKAKDDDSIRLAYTCAGDWNT
jgi:hypothetical protein